MSSPTLQDLLKEFDKARGYTHDLQQGLTADQISWRPTAESSGIAWHLGHQAAVAHFMLRNLTAAEPHIDPEIDALMDSATPEVRRGDLPPLDRIRDYRDVVAKRIHHRIDQIDRGALGAPNQLRTIASTMLIVIVNHEYQHSKWISELRTTEFGLDEPPVPASPRLGSIDGYLVLDGSR